MTHASKDYRARVRLITIISLAIIIIIIVIVGVSFIIGNKLAPSAAPFCAFETDAQQLMATVTGPDCDPTVQYLANRSGKLWTATTLSPGVMVLMEEDVKGPDTLRLYAAQQPGPVHDALALASDLYGAGWRPSQGSPAASPQPTP